MKNLFFVLVLTVLLSSVVSSAMADAIYLDPSAASATSTIDGNTGIFNELQFYLQTSSSPVTVNNPGSVSVGDTFNDVGDLYISALINTAVDLNMKTDWWITGAWDNLAGEIVSFDYLTSGNYIQSYKYTDGTLSLYANILDDANIVSTAFGDTVKVSDNLDVFELGTKIATFDLVSGTGSLEFRETGGVYAPFKGSTELIWKSSYLLEDFWFDSYGNDLSDYLFNINFDVLADSGSDTNNILFENGIVHSDHDGSVEIAVTPEPSTVLLIGSGLLGLTWLSRRRTKKQ